MSKKAFLVISIFPQLMQKSEMDDHLHELYELINTYGGANVVEVLQRRDRPDKATYVGKGKIQEARDIMNRKHIDVILINGIITASQLFTIKQELWDINPNIEVWDKGDLILHIFDKNAVSAEAKLQIQLAQMRHMGPRMHGLGKEMSQQGGGIGTRGIGETNVELMKRHWRQSMKAVEDKLAKATREREKQILNRKYQGLKTVSLVGYTNAGKTSLFNLMTRKNKLAKDALFATLDSTIGKRYFQGLQQEVLFSDTIGFIQNLPHRLIDAFKSTLLESVNADLLLHVIDVGDPHMHMKIETVHQVLEELNIKEKPIMYVFNKVDTMPDWDSSEIIERYGNYPMHYISVKTGDGVENLLNGIEEHFRNF